VNKAWAAVAASGIVLGAAYMLWLYQRTMFGKIENPKNENLKDLNLREFATFAPLIALAIWIGIYPKPFLDRLDTSVARVVARVNPAYPVNARAGCPPATVVAGAGDDAQVVLAGCPEVTPGSDAATVASAALVPEEERR